MSLNFFNVDDLMLYQLISSSDVNISIINLILRGVAESVKKVYFTIKLQ